jgi:hypothetical protein
MSVRVSTTIKLNKSAVNAMLQHPDGEVGAAFQRAGLVTERRIKENIVRLPRIRTGDMMRGIQAQPVARSGQNMTVEVIGLERYTLYQEFGTRTGIAPGRFMRDGLQSLRPEDFT